MCRERVWAGHDDLPQHRHGMQVNAMPLPIPPGETPVYPKEFKYYVHQAWFGGHVLKRGNLEVGFPFSCFSLGHAKGYPRHTNAAA